MPMEKRLRTIKPTPLRGKLTDEEIEWGWEQVSKENERLKLDQEGNSRPEAPPLPQIARNSLERLP